ncbi:MAG: thiol-disulfide isomerase/thioredoxin [Alteromonadaceae bacterium]|jgi:thiol-disulfide isomerase/thioredoxin
MSNESVLNHLLTTVLKASSSNNCNSSKRNIRMKTSSSSKVVTGLLLILATLSFNTMAESAPFSPHEYSGVQQIHEGQRWLMLMWSVDCPPCFKELAQIAKLHQQDSSLAVILVNTDGDEMLDEQREELIKKYKLDSLTNLHFMDGKAAKARFQIDPSWYGELPRSYFYKEDGKRIAKSGLVSSDILKQWLM